jgi:hypothetical protein
MNKSSYLQFYIVFSLIAPLIYFLSDVYKFPLITYFPATDELYWGWKAFSEESGPAMYWYGWLLSSILFSGVLSILVVNVFKLSIQRLVLLSHLSWLMILVMIPFLIQSLKFYWK